MLHSVLQRSTSCFLPSAPVRCRSLTSTAAASFSTGPVCLRGVTVPQEIRRLLGAENIGLPDELRNLPRKGPLSYQPPFVVRYSDRHVTHEWSYKWLDSVEHPFRQVHIKKLVENNHRPLWWQGYVMTADKVIIRSKAKKRLQQFFKLALLRKGYNNIGEKLSPPSDDFETTSPRQSVSRLYGTVHLTTFDPKAVMKVPEDDFVKYFQWALETLETKLGHNSLDRPVSPTQHKGTTRSSNETGTGLYTRKAPAKHMRHPASQSSRPSLGDS